jgi:hypothetical protein
MGVTIRRQRESTGVVARGVIELDENAIIQRGAWNIDDGVATMKSLSRILCVAITGFDCPWRFVRTPMPQGHGGPGDAMHLN